MTCYMKKKILRKVKKMKVRVTLMTENDKHVDESVSDEKLQKLAELSWSVVADNLSNYDDDDITIVEKVEVLER